MRRSVSAKLEHVAHSERSELELVAPRSVASSVGPGQRPGRASCADIA